MTISSLVTLFISMVIVVAIPGPGVLVVTARSLSYGFLAGAITTLGIVCADFIFILLAVLGLSSLSVLFGSFFVIIKYLGALYLIFLGIKLITQKNKNKTLDLQHSTKASHTASYLAGLITTLSNPKAILFYASLFPNLVALSTLTIIDFCLVALVIIVAVCSIMLTYAYLASQSTNVLAISTANNNYFKTGVGGIFIGSGIYIAART